MTGAAVVAGWVTVTVGWDVRVGTDATAGVFATGGVEVELCVGDDPAPHPVSNPATSTPAVMPIRRRPR